MAKTLPQYAVEMQQKITAMDAQLAQLQTRIGSVETLLNGLSAIIAGLKIQVEELLAGGNADVLQPILDQMTTQEATIAGLRARLTAAEQANTQS